MGNIIIGTLAHVDAGKTTLSESMLYRAGEIRSLGRVDHKDAFLDYDIQERNRGITIFSKQAILHWKNQKLTFVDTPGHVDFSTEMERTLQILDYAILVINGIDGIQSHSETIWNLLKHYQIPTFLFVNKMDIAYKDKTMLMEEIQRGLDAHCINFSDDENQRNENIAMCDEVLLNYYLEHGDVSDERIQEAVAERKIFPCYFGSALKILGIDQLLDGIVTYAREKQYPGEFGARVYKITRDEQGNRLTHMKITGGSLKAKMKLSDQDKADQIRQYSGNKFQSVNEISAGEICAIKGPKYICAGEGLGLEEHVQQPMLSAYMNYRVLLPEGCDRFVMLKHLQELAEEDPQLHITYHEHSEEIRLRVMGEIQIEILKHLIKERYDVDVEFDQGSVNYKETIAAPIEGVGHYEPLRHYAEVHLLLEPGEPGSGLQFSSACSEDVLDRHWQRLIMTHLEEKEHLGVLSGSPITDMKITLLSGKAHLKHTEGGDFRQATYRAIRQGLKAGQSVLLEPYYQFRLEIPNAFVSKAIYDIESMHGKFSIPKSDDQVSVITGSAPVSQMQNYQKDVRIYTKGKGKMFCSLQGYYPVMDAESIIKTIGYDSESDLENPTGSIFCAHGAGFYVKWDEVYDHMHVKCSVQNEELKQEQEVVVHRQKHIDDEELERVFHMIYGEPKEKKKKKQALIEKQAAAVPVDQGLQECLLVDGYNMIYAWEDLKEMAQHNIDAARERLIDILCNYHGYRGGELILVFDAYKVEENAGTMYKKDNIYIVYTKSKQTADMYIEQATHKMANQYRVSVATSDGMEQLIVIGQGAQRISARELKRIIEHCHDKEMKEYHDHQPQFRNLALEDIRKLNEED